MSAGERYSREADFAPMVPIRSTLDRLRSDGQRLRNLPERERLPYFESGILIINKIEPTVVIRNDVGLNFSETESIDCASNFFGFDSNGYEKLIAKPVDNQHFCGNGGHLHYLLPCFLRRWTGCVFRLGRAPQGKELRRTYFGRLLPFLNNPHALMPFSS